MGIFRRDDEIQRREGEDEPDRRTTLVLAKLDVAVEKFYDRAERLEEKISERQGRQTR